LLRALQDLARDSSGESTAADASSAFRNLNEHIATDGQECRYCPLCPLISAVREVSPEVKQHLSAAASSLLQAAMAAMSTDTAGRGGTRDSSMEKIDIMDGDSE